MERVLNLAANLMIIAVGAFYLTQNVKILSLVLTF